MRKFGRSRIILALLLMLVCSTVSHAAISKPKNFRIVYMSDKGTVLESFEWSVYAVQQVFLDKLNLKTYIDPKGYEYNVTGYRLTTWPGANYTGKASEEAATYSSILSALRKAYDTLDPPYSLQATLIMKATGNKYSTDIPVHVIWLNQNNEFVKEGTQFLGRDGTYTDKPPKDYEIIGVEAMMTDIWNVGSEITINKNAPTVRYSKFAKEYRIVYRLDLTPEQESDIMGQAESSAEETETTASESAVPGESTESYAEASAAETEASSEPAGVSEEPSENTGSDPAATETVIVPTQTDESFRSGSNKTTLIIGLVIGIAVIYLIVIMIGTGSRNRKPKRKNRI